VTVGWCRNVISRTSVRAGEQAVDLVDESLRSEAERLLDALAEIAAHPVLFVLPPTGSRRRRPSSWISLREPGETSVKHR
jgi:hypothetical protein